MARKPYPSDVTDDEWMFVAPYLTLMREDAPQREHDLRDVFNALRWMVRSGSPWRYLANNFPPWEVVYQQTQRWIKAGVFEAMAHDLREILRMAEGRTPEPSDFGELPSGLSLRVEDSRAAVVIDSRTLQSTPESGHRAGYDGAKRKKGSKIHVAVDTLGHLLTLHVTPADEQDRAQVKKVARDVQKATGKSVELAFVDQGYTGEKPAAAAKKHGIELEVVKLPHAKRGFVLLPRRWVVERSLAWMARCRRLAKDYERLPSTVAGLHFIAFACLMLKNLLRELVEVHNTL